MALWTSSEKNHIRTLKKHQTFSDVGELSVAMTFQNEFH